MGILLQPLTIRIAGGLTLLALWFFLSAKLSPMILATPVDALNRLSEMLLMTEFWQSLVITLIRLLIALTIGASLGFLLGVASGRRSWLKHFLEPLRWVLMSIPPVVVVLLAMLWFGMGTNMVVVIAVLLLTPSIYVNTQKGVEQIDSQWLELAQIYQFSRWQRLTKIYVPAISAPLCATLILVCCHGVRIVVLAEVLGAHDGLGFELANARGNFDMGEFYAWVTMCLLIVAVLEFTLFKPLQKLLLRWKV